MVWIFGLDGMFCAWVIVVNPFLIGSNYSMQNLLFLLLGSSIRDKVKRWNYEQPKWIWFLWNLTFIAVNDMYIFVWDLTWWKFILTESNETKVLCQLKCFSLLSSTHYYYYFISKHQDKLIGRSFHLLLNTQFETTYYKRIVCFRYYW